jgi:uncharacterized protein (TIGR02266 family)
MSRPSKGFVPRADRLEINHEFRSVEAFINEYVSNISRSGVFIKSKDPLPVGTRVNLKFTVLLEEIETIEGLGEVVRVSERPRGMGVVFVHLTEHSQGLVGKLLTRPDAPRSRRRPTPVPPPRDPGTGSGRGGLSPARRPPPPPPPAPPSRGRGRS